MDVCTWLFSGGRCAAVFFSEGTLQTNHDLNNDIGLIYVYSPGLFFGILHVLKCITNARFSAQSTVVWSCLFNNWIKVISTPPPPPPILKASTPYSLDSESLGMDCMISGSASPTLAINTVTNKVLQPALQPPDPIHTWLHAAPWPHPLLQPPTALFSTGTLRRRGDTHTHKHMLIRLKHLFNATHTKIHNYLPRCTFFPLKQQAAGWCFSLRICDSHNFSRFSCAYLFICFLNWCASWCQSDHSRLFDSSVSASFCFTRAYIWTCVCKSFEALVHRRAKPLGPLAAQRVQLTLKFKLAF